MPEKKPIYLVTVKKPYMLAATFLRFQAYYESPRFRKKIFTLEEYMDWYAKKCGEFTYYSDWQGFNIPSWVLKPFYSGNFNPLSKKEIALLDLFKKIKGDFYIIGTTDIAKIRGSTLKHEFIHALFYVCADYRKEVRAILRRSSIPEFGKALRKSFGYSKEVFDDETNAYVLAGLGDLGVRISKRKLVPLRKSLREIFRKHFGFSICRISRHNVLRQVHILRLRPTRTRI